MDSCPLLIFAIALQPMEEIKEKRKRLAFPPEEVKAFALATSLAEAARHYGLKESTVRSMASRGKWMTPDRIKKEKGKLMEAQKVVMEAREGRTIATVADDLEAHLVSSGKSFRTGVASALAKMGEVAGTMDGLTALDHSRKLKDAADIARTILGIGADSGGPSLSINLLNLSADSLSPNTISVSPSFTTVASIRSDNESRN